MWRETYAIVDLERLQHNVRQIKSLLRPGVLFMATVKANGYGHGAIQVSQAVLAAGADMLGVATVEEAVFLRRSGIAADILVYGALPASAASAVVEHRIMATVTNVDDIERLNRIGLLRQQTALVHVKVDTGMGRLGVRTVAEALELLTRASAAARVELAGVYTHLSSADELHLPVGRAYTDVQRSRFIEVLEAAKHAGIQVPITHVASSAGSLWGSDYHFNMVRPGLALYGYHPAPAWQQAIDLKPVLELRSVITRIAELPAEEAVSYGRTYQTTNPERIATVAIGYGDGVPRALSNRGIVEVGGQQAPIVGRICMDQLMIKVTDIPAKVGDEVVVYSGHLTSAASLQRHADLLETIPYELLCRITERVPRHYLKLD